MPFGSGPPDPDDETRLLFVISELKAGHAIPGLTVSADVRRALTTYATSRNTLLPCGSTGPALLLYEVPFGTSGSWAFLSPSVM